MLDFARLNLECGSYGPVLQLQASDANSGATYAVTKTSTGTQIGTFSGGGAVPGGISHTLAMSRATFPSIRNPGSVTITDSVGGSATILAKSVSGC